MRKIICISCPLGCEIEVQMKPGGEYKYSGAQCKNGEKYAFDELETPKRTVTTTVELLNSKSPLLSVRTSAPIPKADIFKLLDLSRKIKAKVPVAIGDRIEENLFATGVDLIATKTILE